MTVELCRTFCEERNDKYYGLQQGRWCYCGDRTPENRELDGSCSYKCGGNQDQYCGGQHTQSFYVNRNYSNGYLGCFNDEADSMFNVKNTSSTSMTVEKCKEFCQKEDVPFYGLLAGIECVCRNSPLPSVNKSDEDCRIKCSGYEKDFCGGDGMIGFHKNSYYEKGYLGCFRSRFNGKSLHDNAMTVELCRTFCEERNDKYYGLQVVL
ncbi:xylosyltransferase oxt-like [Ostrea edulis]|uniref:xylosyltransferase oxt-like n=1 Tax=Ostrea edulis TaxID=37623 RepID=UPI0024AFE7F4|nr:xylosyltransferase oxt-like [Ostrea edulis]